MPLLNHNKTRQTTNSIYISWYGMYLNPQSVRNHWQLDWSFTILFKQAKRNNIKSKIRITAILLGDSIKIIRGIHLDFLHTGPVIWKACPCHSAIHTPDTIMSFQTKHEANFLLGDYIQLKTQISIKWMNTCITWTYSACNYRTHNRSELGTNIQFAIS